MELSFTTSTTAASESIWNLYADVQNWHLWDTDIENITLNGDFQTGSTGVMSMKGMPPLDFTLTAVEPGKHFWDKTTTPMGSIVFGHEIISGDEGEIQIRHTVRLEDASNTTDALDFLRGVFSDVPAAVNQLVIEASK